MRETTDQNIGSSSCELVLVNWNSWRFGAHPSNKGKRLDLDFKIDKKNAKKGNKKFHVACIKQAFVPKP